MCVGTSYADTTRSLIPTAICDVTADSYRAKGPN